MKISIINNQLVYFAAATFIFITVAASAKTINSAQMSPLLQNYLQMHPIDMTVIRQIQFETIRELAQFQQISLDEIAVQINTVKPRSGILPTFDPFYLRELKKYSNEKLSARKSITPTL